jgi:hypothetical protein
MRSFPLVFLLFWFSLWTGGKSLLESYGQFKTTINKKNNEIPPAKFEVRKRRHFPQGDNHLYSLNKSNTHSKVFYGKQDQNGVEHNLNPRNQKKHKTKGRLIKKLPQKIGHGQQANYQ